jgi:hypothetical protein
MSHNGIAIVVFLDDVDFRAFWQPNGQFLLICPPFGVSDCNVYPWSFAMPPVVKADRSIRPAPGAEDPSRRRQTKATLKALLPRSALIGAAPVVIGGQLLMHAVQNRRQKDVYPSEQVSLRDTIIEPKLIE